MVNLYKLLNALEQGMTLFQLETNGKPKVSGILSLNIKRKPTKSKL